MTEACTTATLYWAIAAASAVIPLALLVSTYLLGSKAIAVTYDPPETIKKVVEGGAYSVEARPGAVAYLCAMEVTLYLCVASATCVHVAVTVYAKQAREVCALMAEGEAP